MKTITPFLWFDGKLDEALAHYTSVFPDTETRVVQRREGKAFCATVRLAGQELMLLDGGPHYKLTEAFSLYVQCDTQAEVDELWGRLLEGGKPLRCGWLTDRFGVTWQIIPAGLQELLGDADRTKAARAQQAMMGMIKLDIAELRRAHAGG